MATIDTKHLKRVGLVNLLLCIIYHNTNKEQAETLIRKKNERRKWDQIIESRLCSRRGHQLNMINFFLKKKVVLPRLIFPKTKST